MNLKSTILKVLQVPGVTAVFTPLLRDRATILTLHRFRDDEHETEGIDPEALSQGLAYLRAKRYEIVALDELFARLSGQGPPLRRAVAWTIDDGYYDVAKIAAPVFAQYDCPVTTFVTTGFLDRKIWMWWDQIEHVFSLTHRTSLTARIDGVALGYTWNDPTGKAEARAAFIDWCLSVPDEVKHAGIRALAESAEVEISEIPPAAYRPMSWDQLRECERGGMRFGPHTVTHPILSRTADAQASYELKESWRRLRAEARNPIPIFAYPNGGLEDFGSREVEILRDIGLMGAVVGVWGYADSDTFRRDPEERFKVRRFGYVPDLPHLIQVVTGVERMKRIFRREEAA
jgi:peptidoglycan/xylan/chitin deacetylase (PgdA/CDA1 family)